MVRESDSAIGQLTTVGRVSGRPHRVALRLVHYQGNFYASRRDLASDWCRNLMKDPRVTVDLQGERIHAVAGVLRDDELARKISSFKYQDERALQRRVVIEIVPTSTERAAESPAI